MLEEEEVGVAAGGVGTMPHPPRGRARPLACPLACPLASAALTMSLRPAPCDSLRRLQRRRRC